LSHRTFLQNKANFLQLLQRFAKSPVAGNPQVCACSAIPPWADVMRRRSITRSAPARKQGKCWLRLLLDLSRNVLGEYPDRGAFDRGTGVEQVGCDLLDRVSMSQELRLPGGTQGAPHAGKFVHRSVTDLTLNRFAVVKHRKPKRQSFEVVSQDFASRQRHRNIPQRFV
jgi:hypothetical protein